MKLYSKVISSSKTISFNWYRQDDGNVVESHLEALSETASDIINEQLSNGMREGELLDNIRLADADPLDGIPYRGYWSLLESSENQLDKTSSEYVTSGGCRCINPDCRSENIEGKGVVVELGECYQPVSCNDCGSEWNDVYALKEVGEVVIRNEN